MIRVEMRECDVPASRGIGCSMREISFGDFDPLAAVDPNRFTKHVFLHGSNGARSAIHGSAMLRRGCVLRRATIASNDRYRVSGLRAICVSTLGRASVSLECPATRACCVDPTYDQGCVFVRLAR